MSAAVVWLITGGIVESVADSDVDIVILDFGNIEGGDAVPELSPAHRKLLADKAPALLAELEALTPKFECQNCGKTYRDTVPLVPVIDIHERVAVGEPMPAGECPACGALVHPIETAASVKDWQIPKYDLDRHCLSGSFFVQADAMPVVTRFGLDNILGWFNKKQNPAITVDDTRQIDDVPLKAYFGLDPKMSGGDAFFVTISGV